MALPLPSLILTTTPSLPLSIKTLLRRIPLPESHLLVVGAIGCYWIVTFAVWHCYHEYHYHLLRFVLHWRFSWPAATTGHHHGLVLTWSHWLRHILMVYEALARQQWLFVSLSPSLRHWLSPCLLFAVASCRLPLRLRLLLLLEGRQQRTRLPSLAASSRIPVVIITAWRAVEPDVISFYAPIATIIIITTSFFFFFFHTFDWSEIHGEYRATLLSPLFYYYCYTRHYYRYITIHCLSLTVVLFGFIVCRMLVMKINLTLSPLPRRWRLRCLNINTTTFAVIGHCSLLLHQSTFTTITIIIDTPRAGLYYQDMVILLRLLAGWLILLTRWQKWIGSGHGHYHIVARLLFRHTDGFTLYY